MRCSSSRRRDRVDSRISIAPYAGEIMKHAWIPISLLAFTLADCGSLLGEGDDEPENTNVVTVSTEISSTTTWASGKTYKISADIALTGNLTIQSGVVVSFGEGASLTVKS